MNKGWYVIIFLAAFIVIGLASDFLGLQFVTIQKLLGGLAVTLIGHLMLR